MLVFNNVTLIDGTGGKPIQKSTVIIRGNRFEHVGSEISYPDDSNIIDLHGLTVIPGLIDCHIHLGGLTIEKPGKAIGKVSFIDMVSFFWDYLRNYNHRRRLALENGVTTIRSAGDHYPHIIRLREKIATGRLSGPRIFA
ncbi:unnamed protein product, partial [marine sediment metagenome]